MHIPVIPQTHGTEAQNCRSEWKPVYIPCYFKVASMPIHRGNLKVPAQTMVSQNFNRWNYRLSIEGVASIHLVFSHMLVMLPLSNTN